MPVPRQIKAECLRLMDQAHQEREGREPEPPKRQGSKCIDCYHAWGTDFAGCDTCTGFSNFIFWEPES